MLALQLRISDSGHVLSELCGAWVLLTFSALASRTFARYFSNDSAVQTESMRSEDLHNGFGSLLRTGFHYHQVWGLDGLAINCQACELLLGTVCKIRYIRCKLNKSIKHLIKKKDFF